MKNLTAAFAELDDTQRRNLLRTALITGLSPSLALLTTSCGGGDLSIGSSSFEATQVKLARAEIGRSSIEPDSGLQKNVFPKKILVPIAPFSSVQAALDSKAVLGLPRNSAKAQAITLARAARELQIGLQVMGINAAISDDTGTSNEPSFVLGLAGKVTSAAEVELVIDHLAAKAEGYEIKAAISNIYITARESMGVLNGVQNLLDHMTVINAISLGEPGGTLRISWD